VNEKPNKCVMLIAVLAVVPATSIADTRGGGESSNTNVALNNIVDESTDIWEILAAEGMVLTTASKCTVVACSDVDNASPAGDVGNLYLFTLGLDDTSPGLNTGQERQLELSDNSTINDDNQKHICSTRLFSVGTGTHTIYWLGARASSAAVSTTVLDTSMTVQCFDGSEL